MSMQADSIRPGQGLWKDGPGQAVTLRVNPGFWQYLMYPWDEPAGIRPDVLDTIVHLILELVGCFLLGWWVNQVKFYSDATLLVDSAVLGLVYALTFRMAWGWSVDFTLRRHLNWAITMGYSFIGRGSVVAFLLYGIAQFLGAGLGGLTVHFFNAGSVADYSAAAAATSTGQAIFINIFAGFLIVFTVLYNEIYEFRSEEEHENHKRTGTITAIVIFILVTLFRRHEHYSFGNVVYFASISSTSWASSNTNLPGTTLIDYAAELGFPLVGAVAAVIVFYLVHLLLQAIEARKLSQVQVTTAGQPFIQTFVPAKTYGTPVKAAHHSLADDGLRKRSPLVLSALTK